MKSAFGTDLSGIYRLTFILVGIGFAVLMLVSVVAVLSPTLDIRSRASKTACNPRPLCLDNGTCPQLVIPNVCQQATPTSSATKPGVPPAGPQRRPNTSVIPTGPSGAKATVTPILLRNYCDGRINCPDNAIPVYSDGNCVCPPGLNTY